MYARHNRNLQAILGTILHYENLLDEDNYSDVIEFIEGVIKEMSHKFDLGDINIGPNSVSFEVDNFMPPLCETISVSVII